jgi:hypothetical protein
MMNRGIFGRLMCMSCRPVGVGLDSELEDDGSVRMSTTGW